MSLAKLASLDGVSQNGLAQIEKDRLARMKFIQETMQRMMAGVDTSLLQKQQRAPKPKAPARPQKRKSPADGEVRRSSRIGKLPVPLYYVEEDTTESAPKQRRLSSTPSRGPAGRRCHGTAHLAAAAAGAADPYLWAPPGWKVECGSASMAAADAALAAAAELVKQRTEQGGHAFVKLMSSSQVSGGFWCQLPSDIVPYYGEAAGADKRFILLHCDDKADLHPDSFRYNLPGSSRKWPAVYLPKSDGGGGSGLSGGWRGFAIDMRLNPNDTVVFEVLGNDDPAVALTAAEAEAAAAAAERLKKPASNEAEKAWLAAAAATGPTAAAAAGGASESSGSTTPAAAAAAAAAEGSSGEEQGERQTEGGSKPTPAAAAAVFVQCRLRLHMRAHIFRAADYETDETRLAANPKHELAVVSTPQPAPTLPAAAAASGSDLAEGSGSQDIDQQQQEDSSAATPEADDDVLVDVPLAKHAKVATTTALLPPAGTDTDTTTQHDQQRQQQQCSSGSATPGALAQSRTLQVQGSGCREVSGPSGFSGLLLPPKSPAVVQQLGGLMEAAVAGALPVKVGHQPGSPAAAAAAGAAAAATTAATSKIVGETVVVQGSKGSRRKSAKTGATAAAAAAVTTAPRQKRASAAAASLAWAAAAAAARGTTNTKRRSRAGATAGSSSSSSGVQLVPQPVNPAELVPGPTKDEQRRNKAGCFAVESILGHRGGEGGADDEFLIRWCGFGPYWDSWEPLGNLTAPPGSYKWEGGLEAIPEKFKLAAAR